MNYSRLLQNYKTYTKDFFGERYLSFRHMEITIERLVSVYNIETEGKSEKNQAIKSINFGKGKHKVLIWSQMHGNETTTTKAIFDMLELLLSKGFKKTNNEIIKNCAIKVIPMLNPDGANDYTRVNANQIDLNRDAIARSQKETQVFFKVVEEFKPDFCFNMHGQRSIFSAGNNEFPATVSFLAPAFNDKCAVNNTRVKAMQLISFASEVLANFIPKQIARYDDAFNENCFGDHLTKQGIPTILFEAGHYQNDYFRDKTRQFICISLIAMLNAIATEAFKNIDFNKYYELPENKKLFLDIMIKNINHHKHKTLGILYSEELYKDKILLIPKIETLDNLEHMFAHHYIDAQDQTVLVNHSTEFKIGDAIEELKIGNKIYSDIFTKN